jgi:replicative DNA helicase
VGQHDRRAGDGLRAAASPEASPPGERQDHHGGSGQLGRLADSDIYWDRIVAIEADGEEEVYDLTVDRLHNFVAEDIVVHNSIEQDADLVMFIYRDEYYDRESEREGIADVIISKHRNGGLGTVELTFQKEYPRFMSYVGDDRY